MVLQHAKDWSGILSSVWMLYDYPEFPLSVGEAKYWDRASKGWCSTY